MKQQTFLSRVSASLVTAVVIAGTAVAFASPAAGGRGGGDPPGLGAGGPPPHRDHQNKKCKHPPPPVNNDHTHNPHHTKRSPHWGVGPEDYKKKP
ncbi:hypothetical protein, partial [Actinoplanes sp. NPDC026623]|uniref:hypothetical protein n=1 Tax=Actinoplanes sp. NPDC026623 TaxID=3155610 RepID=UPI0033F36DCD